MTDLAGESSDEAVIAGLGNLTAHYNDAQAMLLIGKTEAAVAASVTIAGGAHRRTTSVDWAVVHLLRKLRAAPDRRTGRHYVASPLRGAAGPSITSSGSEPLYGEAKPAAVGGCAILAKHLRGLGHRVPVSRHDVLREIGQRIADGIRLHRQFFDRNIEVIDPKSVISECLGTRGVPTAGRRKHDVLARQLESRFSHLVSARTRLECTYCIRAQ